MAMSESDWALFEVLVARCVVAGGEASTCLWHGRVELAQGGCVPPKSEPAQGPLDWLDWERRKTLSPASSTEAFVLIRDKSDLRLCRPCEIGPSRSRFHSSRTFDRAGDCRSRGAMGCCWHPDCSTSTFSTFFLTGTGSGLRANRLHVFFEGSLRWQWWLLPPSKGDVKDLSLAGSGWEKAG